MKRLYIAVLSSFGVPTEQFMQSQFKSMESFEHPELHEKSVPLVRLGEAMKRFMLACGVEDFSVLDIIKPEPKQTLRYISAIVNFTKFKQSRQDVHKSVISEMDAAKQQRGALIAQNKELKRKILELKAKKAEEDQQVNKLEDEVEELQNIVSELKKQQAEEMNSIQQLKTSNAVLGSQKAEMKANLAGLKQEGERLMSTIVESPERLKGELSRLKSAVQAVREARNERSARLQEICNQQESSLQFIKDAQTALEMITGIALDMDKLREETAKLEDLQDKNISQKEVLRDMTAKIEQLRQQQASKQEKLSRVIQQHGIKIAATHDASDQLEREQMHLEKKIAEKENYLEQLNNQMATLSLKLKEEDDLHEEEMGKLRTLYQQLLGQLENYHHRLNRGWDKVMTATNKLNKQL